MNLFQEWLGPHHHILTVGDSLAPANWNGLTVRRSSTPPLSTMTWWQTREGGFTAAFIEKQARRKRLRTTFRATGSWHTCASFLLNYAIDYGADVSTNYTTFQLISYEL